MTILKLCKYLRFVEPSIPDISADGEGEGEDGQNEDGDTTQAENVEESQNNSLAAPAAETEGGEEEKSKKGKLFSGVVWWKYMCSQSCSEYAFVHI